jgi:hypothetical protein
MLVNEANSAENIQCICCSNDVQKFTGWYDAHNVQLTEVFYPSCAPVPPILLRANITFISSRLHDILGSTIELFKLT